MDRGDDRLRRIFHQLEHLGEAGRLRRLAEFGDVGAGDEGAAGAGQHDRLHLGIGDRALHAFEDAAAHRGAQRVNRRAVDRDDGDVVMTFEFYHFAHGTLPDRLFLDAARLALSGYGAVFNDFALRNLIPHLDSEGYFEARALSTSSSAAVAGNEASGKEELATRSQLRRRTLSRARRVARISSQRRPSWQSGTCCPHQTAEADDFPADLYPDQARLPYTCSAFRKVSACAISHGAGVCRTGQSRRPAFVGTLSRRGDARDRRRRRRRRRATVTA